MDPEDIRAEKRTNAEKVERERQKQREQEVEKQEEQTEKKDIKSDKTQNSREELDRQEAEKKTLERKNKLIMKKETKWEKTAKDYIYIRRHVEIDQEVLEKILLKFDLKIIFADAISEENPEDEFIACITYFGLIRCLNKFGEKNKSIIFDLYESNIFGFIGFSAVEDFINSVNISVGQSFSFNFLLKVRAMEWENFCIDRGLSLSIDTQISNIIERQLLQEGFQEKITLLREKNKENERKRVKRYVKEERNELKEQDTQREDSRAKGDQQSRNGSFSSTSITPTGFSSMKREEKEAEQAKLTDEQKDLAKSVVDSKNICFKRNCASQIYYTNLELGLEKFNKMTTDASDSGSISEEDLSNSIQFTITQLCLIGDSLNMSQNIKVENKSVSLHILQNLINTVSSTSQLIISELNDSIPTIEQVVIHRKNTQALSKTRANR